MTKESKNSKYIFSILMIIAVISFFEPLIFDRQASMGISKMVRIHTFFSIIKYMVFITTIFLYLIKFDFVLKKFLFYFVFYSFLLFISTVLKKGSISSFIAVTYPTMTFIMISELAIFEGDFYVFNKITFFILSALIILNLIFMFVYPNGMYTDYRGWSLNWLFGNYQQNITYFIPVIVSGLITVYHSKKYKLLFIISVISIFISTYLSQSKTTIVMLFIMVFLYFFNNCKYVRKKILPLSIFKLTLFFSVLVIIFRMQYIFRFIIVDMLQKDLTFNGRTKIWDVVVSIIKDNFFIGVGVQSNETLSSLLTVTSKVNRSTHNQYLTIQMMGGIVLSCTFYNINRISLKRLNKFQEYKIAKVLFVGISGFFIFFIAEAWRNLMYYFTLLTYAYYIEIIIDYKGELK